MPTNYIVGKLGLMANFGPNFPISKKLKGKKQMGKIQERKIQGNITNVDGSKVEATLQPH